MSKTVTVYADPISQPSRSVIIFCKAAKIPHKVHPIRFQAREHKSPEFLEITPMGTVPAVVDSDGIVIRDSAAAFRYLATKFDVAEHWIPRANAEACARVDEYLHWHHMNTRLASVEYFWQAFLLPRMKGLEVEADKEKKLRRRLIRVAQNLERIFLRNSKFISGNEVSVADLAACCELEQCSVAGLELKKEVPALGAYMERVRLRLAPHYDDVHKDLYEMRRDMMQSKI